MIFFQLISPWLLVLLAAMVLLLCAASRELRGTIVMPLLTLAALACSLVLSWQLWLSGASAMMHMLLLDRLSFWSWIMLLLCGILVTLLSYDYLRDRGQSRPEYYALLLFALIGMGALVSSQTLLMVFLGVETMSIASYALTGFFRERQESNEAALKYLLAGAFASAFLLMGIAFIYGATGSTNLSELKDIAAITLAAPQQLYLALGTALLLVGFGFKVAAAPFHAWAPDVYEGAPTPVTAFMATAVKVAAFVGLWRVGEALFQPGLHWDIIVAALAVATMVWGNVGAIAQDNVKRMLAYSSIAHAGYALVGVVLVPNVGVEALPAVLFYLLSYMMMTLGAFAVLIAVQGQHGETADINRLAGLGHRRPMLAAMLSLFLLSLTGFPPLMGFFAKYYLFLEAVRGGWLWLVVVALLNSAISAYYYLRPVMVMYFGATKEDDAAQAVISPWLTTVIVMAALTVLVFGILPSQLLAIVQNSAS